MSNQATTFGTAAYGGPGWSPRSASHAEEIGSHWAACGLENEWAPLKAVLLHRPGPELAVEDFNAAQLLEKPNFARAVQQHDALATTYRTAGVSVHYVEPAVSPASPNQIFCADLFAMTPEGAILARPASTVRAGEERWVARRLADLGAPILATLTGHAVFEGADLIWLDRETAAIARGLRTNDEAIAQIRANPSLSPADKTQAIQGLEEAKKSMLALPAEAKLNEAELKLVRARYDAIYKVMEESN